MELTVLSVEEGGYVHAGTLKTKPKQQAVVALRAWIQKHGEGGKVYIACNWKTPQIEAQVGFTLVERKKLQPPKAKPAPVEVEG